MSRQRVTPAAPVATLPELHLSGPKLRAALDAALTGCEALGGVERYIEALRLKSRLFREVLLDDAPGTLDSATCAALCAFMPTVRRRLVPLLGTDGLARVRTALALLLADLDDTASTEQRLAACRAQFPHDRAHRWVRDLGAEVLHNVDPERYPLMTRWVWDARANTGALREIWFGPESDSHTLAVADDYDTFLALRQELAVFLTDSGFFRDLPFYVDLLLAQVYAEYICAQGGTYLRADFSSPEDPMQHTRRMLGLDGVRGGRGALRTATLARRAGVLERVDG